MMCIASEDLAFLQQHFISLQLQAQSCWSPARLEKHFFEARRCWGLLPMLRLVCLPPSQRQTPPHQTAPQLEKSWLEVAFHWRTPSDGAKELREPCS